MLFVNIQFSFLRVFFMPCLWHMKTSFVLTSQVGQATNSSAFSRMRTWTSENSIRNFLLSHPTRLSIASRLPCLAWLMSDKPAVYIIFSSFAHCSADGITSISPMCNCRGTLCSHVPPGPRMFGSVVAFYACFEIPIYHSIL